jgi:hypothetical protein
MKRETFSPLSRASDRSFSLFPPRSVTSRTIEDITVGGRSGLVDHLLGSGGTEGEATTVGARKDGEPTIVGLGEIGGERRKDGESMFMGTGGDAVVGSWDAVLASRGRVR